MSACPATPERTDNCPATPEHLKTPHLDSSSDDDNERNSQSPSGDVKCAICLSNRCKNKCFTDSCLHQFCFKCLSEWSKIKAECPLCKQTFKSIIHNVKSIEQYEEYLVQPTPQNQPPPPQHQPYQPYPYLPNNSPSVYHRLDFLLSEPPRFTYSATLQVRPHQGEAIQQLFLHHSDLTERYSREYANDSIPFRQHAQEWRQYIYERELYALPLADITGRVRECSAAFYRNNPAQIHRLMPWLNREMVALLRNNAYQINSIFTDIQDVLMRHDITSEEFRQYFRRYCRNSTNHFIHEFLNYARSPYDMIGYDRNVRYTPYFNSVPEVIFSSDEEGVTETTTTTTTSNNDDVISVSNPRTSSAGGRTQFTIETRSAHSTVIVTGSFGGGNGATSTSSGNNDMATATTTTSTTSSTYTPQPISNRRSLAQQYYDLDVEEVPPPIALRSSSDSQSTAVELVTQNISLSSDTDSDECRFVLERKPPHLRTPEMVSLDSESDSDVVYVESEVPDPPADENGTTARSRRRMLGIREDPPPGVFEPTADDSGNVGSFAVGSPTKVLKSEIQHQPSTIVTRQSATAVAKTEPNKLNCGASTSTSDPTAADGSDRSLPPIKMKFLKYYAKPKYLRSTTATRSILEPSSSSDSESESSHEEFKLGGGNDRGRCRKRKTSATTTLKRKSDESGATSSRKRPKRSSTQRSRSTRVGKTDDKGSSKTKKTDKKTSSKREIIKPTSTATSSSSSASSSTSATSSSLEQSSSSSSGSSSSSSVSSSRQSPAPAMDGEVQTHYNPSAKNKTALGLSTTWTSSTPWYSSSDGEQIEDDSDSANFS